MSPLPEAILAVLLPFAPLFSRPAWVHVQVLLAGARLRRGPCTVAAVLRVMGLGAEPRFARYHRVLSRARWSGLQAARILLGLLLAVNGIAGYCRRSKATSAIWKSRFIIWMNNGWREWNRTVNRGNCSKRFPELTS